MMPYSGDRRPSPPQQPHATLSYLSPSATPFTVSRPHDATPDPIPNAPTNPSPYPELPTAPSLYDSWVEPPASYMDLEAGATPGFRGFANSDGFLVSGNARNDIYSGNHFGTSMQPLPFTTGSLEWMEEKYPGIYQRTSKAPSSDFGSAVVQQPSASPNMFACLDTKPCSTPQPVNQYSPYSAYGNYTSHLPSCSTYPLSYDLSMPSVAASPEVGAATKPLSPTTDGHVLENTFQAPYTNPCRLNLAYFDTIQNEQKDHFGYETSYEQYGGRSSSDNGTRIMGSHPLSRRGVGENHLLGESSETGRPVQPGTYPLSRHGVGENYLLGESSETRRLVQPSSEAKSGLINLEASCSKVSPSEYSFAQPRELFIESLEVNNPVVDSPCWKGTPTAQQPSFGVVNDEASYSANGSVDLPDLHQSKKLSEFSANNSVLLPKRHDTSNPENDLCVPDYLYYLSAFSRPSGCSKSEGHNGKQPSNVGDVSGMEKSNHGHVSVDQGTRRDNHVNCCKTGDVSGNVVTPVQQGNVFLAENTNEPMFGRNGGSHLVGTSEESGKVSNNVSAAPIAQVRSLTKESLQEITRAHKAASTWANLHSKMPMNKGLEHLTHCNTGVEESVKISSDKVTCRSNSQEELIKSIYNFSVMLLSSCGGGYQLKESEHALVQSVIQNLSSLSSTISKASFKSDDVTTNCCQMKSEKIKCNGKNHQPEKFAGFDWENIGTDFKTVILQDLAKLPEENLDGDTKDAQMMVYKNLWIEAEASTCKLKYELQLARMKLATKNQSQQTATAPTDSLGEAKASNLLKPENSLCTGESDDSSKQQNPVRESHIHNTTLLPKGGDADVFARLKVLKLRDESINCFHEVNSKLQTERSEYNRTDHVDDTVFDNDVDARINSLVEDIIKERPEASSSEADEADGTTTAALNFFLSCNNNTSSLDEDTNIEQLESSESKTNGAFMAKLKDLMRRSDDISSSSEVNACQLQTASEHESSQFGQLEDGVMARLQVLKRRIDNTSSMEGQEVVFDPDDWLGHFERKPFGRGGHDELIEKTGMSDDAEFRALSDEADRNTTTQYAGSLLEECHVPSAPAEPATVHLHDERLSHSPSEWEHVLKEDFFLPGNPMKEGPRLEAPPPSPPRWAPRRTPPVSSSSRSSSLAARLSPSTPNFVDPKQEVKEEPVLSPPRSHCRTAGIVICDMASSPPPSGYLRFRPPKKEKPEVKKEPAPAIVRAPTLEQEYLRQVASMRAVENPEEEPGLAWAIADSLAEAARDAMRAPLSVGLIWSAEETSYLVDLTASEGTSGAAAATLALAAL
ncbi:hypothetical protein ACQ4PT_003667 [Festuca glaucescens]